MAAMERILDRFDSGELDVVQLAVHLFDPADIFVLDDVPALELAKYNILVNAIAPLVGVTCTIPKQSRPLRVSRLFTVWVPRTKSRAWPFSLLRRPQRMSPEARLSLTVAFCSDRRTNDADGVMYAQMEELREAASG